jgi:hypothetical protein
MQVVHLRLHEQKGEEVDVKSPRVLPCKFPKITGQVRSPMLVSKPSAMVFGPGGLYPREV